MENKEANKLIYGIKWENKELLDELERRGIFENLNFIITGLYLAARFRKGRSYQRLANNLENWKHSHLTGNNFKPKSGDKESEELDQLIKGATKKVDNPLTIKEEEEDRLDSNIINTSNVHNELTTKESSEYEMVSKESWTYKLLMLHTLYSCITISDQTIILYVIQDYALTITAKLVYILLKNELFDVIKEIISHNIPIINDQGSIEEYALFQNLSTLSNLRQFYISNKSRLCPADMVDFMLKNKLDQLKTNKFIKECKNLKDNTIIEILLKHNQEFWAEKLIKENFDYSDGVVIAAIKHECFMFLLFYIRVTSGELFELEEEIIELIIEKIADDVKHIEYYLFLLLRYKQYVSLAHSKTFFNQINKCLSYHEAEIAFVIGQPNPMKITILIIELVLEIMKSITVMKIMGNKILADLISFVQKMQAQVENENQLRQIFYDKDIANREVINIIGSNNLISLLENKNMQVIISDIWSGPYPLEGKMRQTTSSLYFLLAHGGKTSRDLELINRPKIFIRNIHTMKYHPYQFMAWKDGINIRYLFEAGIFVLLFYLNFSSSNELHDELLKFLKDFLRKALPPGSSNFEDINYAVLPDKFKADWKALIYIIYTIMMSRLNLIYIYIFLLFHYLYQVAFLILAKRLVTFSQFFRFELIVDIIVFLFALFNLVYLHVVISDVKESVLEDKELEIQVKSIMNFTNKPGLQVIIALLLTANALRVFTIFRVNSTLGPLITMLKLMIINMLAFFFLYFANMVTFACLATILIFPSDNEKYSSLYNSSISLFQASLGNFDFEDVHSEGNPPYSDYICDIFLVIFLLINIVLFMNFLIAILSNIYSIYEQKSHSLYMVEIVKIKIFFASDDQYGCLISSPNPLSVIVNSIPFVLFLITYGCQNRQKIHKCINYVFLYIEYSCLFIWMLLIYILFSTIYMPLVYIKWGIIKIGLIFVGTHRSTASKIGSALTFLIFGLFILTMNYLADIYFFCFHSYSTHLRHISSTKRTDYMSKEIYLKILDFAERNQDTNKIVPYEIFLNKIKQLCGLKDIKFMEYNSEVPKAEVKSFGKRLFSEEIVNEKKRRYRKSETRTFLQLFSREESTKINRSKKQIVPQFEGKEDLSKYEQEKKEGEILNLASMHTLIKNIILENHDGVKVIYLPLFYRLLHVNVRMGELKLEYKRLSKQSTKSIIERSTSNIQNEMRKARSSSMKLLSHSLREENKAGIKFLSENVLMSLLHSYRVGALKESTVSFKTRKSKSLKVDYILRELRQMGLHIAKERRERIREMEGFNIRRAGFEANSLEVNMVNKWGKRKKNIMEKANDIVNRLRTENYIEGASISEGNISWLEDNSDTQSEVDSNSHDSISETPVLPSNAKVKSKYINTSTPLFKKHTRVSSNSTPQDENIEIEKILDKMEARILEKKEDLGIAHQIPTSERTETERSPILSNNIHYDSNNSDRGNEEA